MEDVAKDVTNQLCKLRLIVRDRPVDIALPADVPLVDLLPTILRHAGSELADEGVEHDGWVLQRLGQPPLDEARTPSELGLLDGETVHLRPRVASLPEIDFDDLVDGIGERSRNRDDAWTDRLSRWMLLAFAEAALLLGVLVLALGGPVVVRAAAAGATALVLLVVATGLSRGRSDSVSGTAFALSGTVYLGLLGWLVPELAGAGAAASWACAGSFALAGLVLGLVGVGDAALLFVSGLVAVVPLTATAAIAATTALHWGQAAGIALTAALIGLGLVPSASFRLAGLSLPPLPSSAEEFGEDLEPVPHGVVVERTALANRYMTGLYTALGGTSAVLLTVLISSAEMWAMITAGVAVLLLLLRSRNVVAARQRWALLAPAGWAAVLDLREVAALLPAPARASVFGGALALALVLLVCSAALPGRKLRPYWGRAVDLLETVCAIALIPLLLATLDVYALVRGMTGS